MVSPRILIVLFAAMVVSVGLVACGGDDNSSATATKAPAATTARAAGGSATPKAVAGSTTPASAAAAVLKVTASDFKFEPTSVDAPVGKEVTMQLTNTGSAPHTLTVYSDDAHTKKVAGAEARASSGQKAEFKVTFDKAGEYYFRCEIHPTKMSGEIKVN